MADFNGDGHADIVAGRSGTDQTEVYPGDGHGGFAAPSTLPGVGPQVDPAVYLIGDLNHDTKLDLIITRGEGWNREPGTHPGLTGNAGMLGRGRSRP